MTHPIWPLFDLRVTTPRVELRSVDPELAVDLAELGARGIHDPAFMPFLFPWTDVEPPLLQRNTLQWYWRSWAEWRPDAWNCQFAVLIDGEVVGTTSLHANDFAILRTFESGSWLGREHQGRGIGREMREATLHLGFAALDAEMATTEAFADNAPSLGVTRRLGYERNGTSVGVRRGEPAEKLHFRMLRRRWETNLRRDDITVEGLEPCRQLFGI